MGWSRHHQFGLIHHEPDRAFPGYTLIVPNGGLDNAPDDDIDRYAMLIDREGRVCHRWESERGLKHAYLLPNGNLLARTRAPLPVEGGAVIGGTSSAIVELDWESNVVWSFEDRMIHHDFERLPNGNTLVLLWGQIPEDTASQVAGGYTSRDGSRQMLGDVVQEITPSGLVAFEWRSWEHLDFTDDVICPLEWRETWTYGNSLSATPEGNFVVSFRSTSVVGIVDRASGDFTWKWGPGRISHQHHPTYLPNGRVLIFDNGVHGRGAPRSRVIEVDPSDENRITWQYVGNPPVSFFSPLVGSADRLPNGNTLICEGSHGRVFEVTDEKEIVWEYISPYFLPIQGGESNALFRAHRYGPDHPAFADKDLDPGRYASLNEPPN